MSTQIFHAGNHGATNTSADSIITWPDHCVFIFVVRHLDWCWLAAFKWSTNKLYHTLPWLYLTLYFNFLYHYHAFTSQYSILLHVWLCWLHSTMAIIVTTWLYYTLKCLYLTLLLLYTTLYYGSTLLYYTLHWLYLILLPMKITTVQTTLVTAACAVHLLMRTGQNARTHWHRSDHQLYILVSHCQQWSGNFTAWSMRSLFTNWKNDV